MPNKATRKIIESKLATILSSGAATSQSVGKIVTHMLAIHDALGDVRGPLRERAKAEQRNDAWLQQKTREGFGERLRELTRLGLEVQNLMKVHGSTKPSLPAFDRTDLLACMETIELAKRVGGSQNYQKTSPAERLAALRAPGLANLPDDIAQRWENDAIRAAEPERAAAFSADQKIIAEAASAVGLVERALQEEAGFIDAHSGDVLGTWQGFERMETKAIREEFERSEAIAENGRKIDAVEAARRALSAAEREHQEHEQRLLKSL